MDMGQTDNISYLQARRAQLAFQLLIKVTLSVNYSLRVDSLWMHALYTTISANRSK